MAMTVGGSAGADLGTVAARARELENLGYDFLAVGETQHDPFLPLTLVAEHTRHIRFGTSVAIAFPRAPHIVANLSWDLAKFSGGRFVLGLGTQVKGHNERRFSVPWAPPGPRLRDYIGCLRAIWDSWQHGTRPAYESEHYQYKLTSPVFNPGPIEHPDIRVVISAVNPFNARLAGEVCDGIALHGFSTFEYTRRVILPALEEGARRAGKRLADLDIRGGGFIVTGRTAEDVARTLEATRRQLAFYGSTRSYARVMQLHGWEDEAALLHRLSIEGRWDALGAVMTDEMLEQFCVIGTWDEIAAKARTKYAGINTQITLDARPRNPDEAAQIREVVAELRRIPTVGE